MATDRTHAQRQARYRASRITLPVNVVNYLHVTLIYARRIAHDAGDHIVVAHTYRDEAALYEAAGRPGPAATSRAMMHHAWADHYETKGDLTAAEYRREQGRKITREVTERTLIDD